MPWLLKVRLLYWYTMSKQVLAFVWHEQYSPQTSILYTYPQTNQRALKLDSHSVLMVLTVPSWIPIPGRQNTIIPSVANKPLMKSLVCLFYLTQCKNIQVTGINNRLTMTKIKYGSSHSGLFILFKTVVFMSSQPKRWLQISCESLSFSYSLEQGW